MTPRGSDAWPGLGPLFSRHMDKVLTCTSLKVVEHMVFLFRRETLKQSIIDSSRKEGKKSKFLCAKRTNKKKRKMYNAEYNDGKFQPEKSIGSAIEISSISLRY